MTDEDLYTLRFKIEKEATLQQLCAHNEFTRDIERGELDREEAAELSEDRSTLYVFDENIFEMFLNPSSFQRYFAVSYANSWADGLYGFDEYRKIINAQSALIASEHLFNKLPGQALARPIFVTEWHFRELYARVNILKDRLARFQREMRAAKTGRAKRKGRGKNKAERTDKDIKRLIDFATARRQLDADDFPSESTVLGSDLRDMQSKNVDVEQVREVYLAREAAEMFSSPSNLHLLAQMKRFFSDDLMERLTPLHTRFRPSGDNERGELRAEIAFWRDTLQKARDQRHKEQISYGQSEIQLLSDYQVLLKEYIEQGNGQKILTDSYPEQTTAVEMKNVTARLRHLARRQEELIEDQGADRGDASLKVDARALAYILWICRSNRLKPGQKLVMVTGDELLFNAYRKWYSEKPRNQPFVLRRAVQYAPILTLDEVLTKKVLSSESRGERDDIFFAARKAVISQLISLSLQKDGPDTGREAFAAKLASRERLLQDNQEVTGAIGEVTTQRLRDKRRELVTLREGWQKAERDAIGANYEYISNRFDPDLENALRAPDPQGSKESLARYFETTLNDLSESAISLWFPLATDFIGAVKWRDKSQARVPIALRLTVPGQDPNSQDDLGTLVDNWIDGRNVEAASLAAKLLSVDENKELAQRTDFIFAVAATLALRIAHWSDAERFADLAKQSAKPKAEDPKFPRDFRELKYLHAMSLRFRLGNTALGEFPASPSLHNRWLELLDSSVDLLTECEEFHAQKLSDGSRQTLRMMRAISERAAMRLFYAMWGAASLAAEPLLEDLKPKILQRVREELLLARGELTKCRGLETEGMKRAENNERRRNFLKLIKRQYLTNMASCQVIVAMLSNKGMTATGMALEQRDHAVWQEAIRQFFDSVEMEKLPIIARVDILAYQALFGLDDRDKAKSRAKLEDLHAHIREASQEGKRSFNLILDEVGTGLIFQHIELLKQPSSS